jgi:phosphatidylinositol alpha-mannosyltransferase
MSALGAAVILRSDELSADDRKPPAGTTIALVHPTYWPEVRRGSERVIHDLAHYLAERGFAPSILTAHRARPQATEEDGVRVLRGWRLPRRLQPPGFEPHTTHAPLALLSLLRGRFDLAHAFHLPDAYAAAAWSRLARRPLVVSLMGLPDRRALSAFKGRERFLRASSAQAAAVHVLSDAAREALFDATGLQATVINPGTNSSAFEVAEPRAARPTIFCASAAADPRKRVGLLVEAFQLLRGQVPDARLLITGPAPPATDWSAVPGVELVSAHIPQRDLARLYAGSWLTVLPSEREAFGQVLVESLAAGTPVVAVAGGGADEIIDSARIGMLCDRPEPQFLAETLRRALDLGRHPATRERCKQHAIRWDWSRIGPKFEALYRDAFGAERP